MKRCALIGSVVLIALSVHFYREGQKSAQLTPELGLDVDRLRPCPDRPNCVTSNNGSGIAPVKLKTNPMQNIKAYAKTKGWKLEDENETYLRFTVTSGVFKFVDDVEFNYLDGELHMRSASRVGYWDFGANADRLEHVSMIISATVP